MPDPTLAPPPNTPPPNPAPPAAPPAQPSAPPAPAPSGSGYKPGNFDDLDTLGDEGKQPTGTTPPSGGSKPEPTEPRQKPEGGTPSTAPDPAKLPEFKTNKELREWAIGRHKIASEIEKKTVQLEAKIKELEARGAPESVQEAAAKQLADFQKKIDDYESQMRLISYERSQEYSDKFRTPLDKAITSAHKEMEELQVHTKGPDGEDAVRAATAMDFNEVYNTSGPAGRELAKKKFGDDWQVVWAHRNKIKEITESARTAVEDYGKKWKEQEQQNTLKSKGEAEAARSMWAQVNKDLSTKYDYFRPSDKDEDGKPKDPEGDALWEKGLALADSAMGENRARLTLQERILIDAQIRNRAAGFARMARKAKLFEAEIARQAKLIEELRGGSPGGKPKGGAGPQPKTEAKTWEDAFDDQLPD